MSPQNFFEWIKNNWSEIASSPERYIVVSFIVAIIVWGVSRLLNRRSLSIKDATIQMLKTESKKLKNEMPKSKNGSDNQSSPDNSEKRAIPSQASELHFIADIQVSANVYGSANASTHVIHFSGKAVANVDRIRMFADIWYRSSTGVSTWSEPMHVALTQFDEVVKGQLLESSIAAFHPNPLVSSDILWGNPTENRPLCIGPNLVRLRFIGPNNAEQGYNFMVVLAKRELIGDTSPTYMNSNQPIVIVRQCELNWE